MHNIARGGTITFTAKVEGINHSQTVTWYVDGGGEGTSVDRDSGRLTVAADETAQTLTVRAVSAVDPAKFGTADVTVMAAVTSVTINPGTISVKQGESHAFTADVQGTNNPAQTVAWYVVGGSDGTSIDRNSGVLTVAADETAETLTVRAVSTVDPAKFGTADVTVMAAVTGVTVSPGTISVEQDGTKTFTTEIAGNDDPSPAVTWSVIGGGAGTAIGSTSGVLTVAEGETAETLTVRAVSDVSGKSGTANVTVLAAGKASVTLIYPADDDKASGELSGFTNVVVTPNTSKELIVNAAFDSYRWQVDGRVKGTAKTFTLNADDYAPGKHQLSLEVTLNGMVYSKSGAFTVQH
jgi:hypothetical protein